MTYQLDFYANETVDSSGFGEGGRYIGSLDLVGTGASQNFNTTTLDVSLDGEFVTATATRAGAETSEFSQAVTATALNGAAIVDGSLIVIVVPDAPPVKDFGETQNAAGQENLDEGDFGTPLNEEAANDGVVFEGDEISLTGVFEVPGPGKEVRILWGDGGVSVSGIDDVNVTENGFSASYIYSDDTQSGTAIDTQTIRVIVTDTLNSASGQTTRSLDVANVPAEFGDGGLIVTPSGITEGSSITLSGDIVDPGATEFFELLIDWGDDTTQVYPVPFGDSAFSVTHVYQDDSPGEIRVTLTDDDSGSAVATAQAIVTNLPPVAAISGPTVVEEGTDAIFSAASLDPGANDEVTNRWLIFEGGEAIEERVGNTIAINTTYSGSYTVRLIAEDDEGATSFVDQSLEVINAIPEIVPGSINVTNTGGGPIVEGDTVNLTGLFTDTGPRDTHFVTIDWGDGSPTEELFVDFNLFNFAFSHTYQDDHPVGTPADVFNVMISVRDDSDASSSFILPLIVNNVDPAVQIVPTLFTGSNVTLDALAQDVPGDPLTFEWTVTDTAGIATTSFGPTLSFDPNNFTDEAIVEVVVHDDDGGMTIERIGLVLGTQNEDRIDIDPGSTAGSLEVTRTTGSDTQQLSYDGVDSLLVVAGDSDDIVEADPTVTQNLIVDGGAGNDAITTAQGDDYVDGGDGNDMIATGAGDDTLRSEVGDDTLDGGLGNDTNIIAGFSSKTLIDAGGIDTIDFAQVGASAIPDEGVSLNLSLDSGQVQNVRSDGQVSLAGQYENVVGTGFRDNLIGNSRDNLLFGGSGQDDVTGGDGNDVIYGGAGDDTLTGGGDGNDLIFGGPGSDTITGGEGNDIVYGGDGGDIITGSEGNDLIFGGAGDDTVTGGDGNAAVYGQGGNDILTGGTGNDLIFGGPGTDTITGGEGNDIVYGGQGDDNITGGSSGNDLIFGGPGDDTITGGDGNEVVYGGSGGDIITGSEGNDLIFGGAGDDTVTGGDGNAAIYGEAGNDILDGGTGNDLIFGGPGEDTIAGGDGNDIVYGGGGNDDITGGSSGNDLIFGGPGDDTVTGGDGNEIVYGGDGDDTIVGSDGNDLIFGGAGDDTVTGGDGNAAIYGGGGMDNIDGGGGNDLIFGGPGNDTITGGDGNDMVYGGGGDDMITGSSGNDLIFGGAGDDTVTGGEGNEIVYGGTGSDTITGGDGNDLIFGGSGDDNLSGGDGNDAVYGDAGNDIVTGSSGNDLIFGGAGDDTVIGGEGNEIVYGGSGSDTITGGDGNDLIFGGSGDDNISGGDGNDAVYGDAGNDIITGSSGNDLIFGGAGDDTVTGGEGNEVVYGGSGDDVITGGDGNDLIFGGPGDDTVTGGDGNDMVYGGDGNDDITGSLGNDLIFGGPGDDTIVGGDGNEIVYGGAGDDSIVGSEGNDLIFGGPGADTILVETSLILSNEPVAIFGGDDTGPDNDEDRLIALTNTDLTLSSSTVSIGLVGNITFSDIQVARLVASPNNNVIDASGFTGDAVLIGGDGDDILIGGSGNDELIGGAGNNQLTGGGGDDIYRFDVSDAGNNVVTEAAIAGTDTLDFSLVSTPISIDLEQTGTQTVTSGLSIEIIGPANIENVIGTQGDDVILGNAADNTLVGLGGLDTLDGRAGNDILQAGGRRLIFLDFDSETDGLDHVYSSAERQAILQRMREDYQAFDVSIEIIDSTTVLPSVPFVRVIFNAGLASQGSTIVGGLSQRIGFRELAGGGLAFVNANAFLRPDDSPIAPNAPRDNRLNGTPENYIALSSTIASHELAHTFGLRHHDSFGPVGNGVFTGLGASDLLPIANISQNADDTRFHLIASPDSVGTDLIDAFGNPFFGEREALKLAFAENGITAIESLDADKTFSPVVGAEVQSLGVLPKVVVPDSLNPFSTIAPDFAAINVAGQIDQPLAGEVSESDFYSFQGVPGDVLTIEVMNETLRHRFDLIVDTVIRVYGPDGQVIEYQGDTTFGAFNDNSFDSLDALLFDLVLPARTDLSTDPQDYFIEVDTFSFDIPELNTAGVPSYIGNFNDVAFCNANPTNQSCADTDHGPYELFIYRFDGAIAGAPSVGDTLIGGPGADLFIGNSGVETLVGFNVGDGDVLEDPSGAAVFQGTAPTIDLVTTNYAIGEGAELSFSVPATDVDNDILVWTLEPIAGQNFPIGANVISLDPVTGEFSFTPTDDGDFAVRIVATDPLNLSDSVDVFIQATNEDPDASIDFVSTPQIEATPITVNGSATDPAGANDTLTFTYNVFKDGATTPFATNSGASISQLTNFVRTTRLLQTTTITTIRLLRLPP